MSDVFATLTLILLLGVAAQWVGWRFKIPAILILLCAGFLAGPVTGIIQPDAMFGDVLFPVVSAAVAVILFEGGLSLNLSELKGTASTVVRFVTVGVIVTWTLAGLLAWSVLGLDPLFAALFGAMLTVTGPTVIGPMLRTIRPRGRVKNIAKWEGILNDPIGVILAVLVFEAVLAGGMENAPEHMAFGIIKTLFIGVGGSALAAGAMIVAIRKKWVPEFLHNIFVLALTLTVFGASNYLQEESGLLTVTLLGIILANQRYFDIRHITEFKENLQVVLISSLFIVLAARVDPATFSTVGLDSLLFLVALIFVVRPLSVLASTAGTRTTFREGILLSLLAPRGIVAVALTSLFAIKLGALGDEAMAASAERLLAEMLVVVLGTVLFYGLSAPRAASALGLSNLSPQGVLLVGAHTWARYLAAELKALEVPVMLIDANRHHTALAEQEELHANCGNVFSEEFLKTLDFSDLGHVVALTSNDEVNAIARNSLADFFERSEIYHLTPHEDTRDPYGEAEVIGNPAFSPKATYENIEQRFRDGARFRHVTLREGFNASNFAETYAKALPLFLIESDGRVRVYSSKTSLKPKIGATIVFLHKAQNRKEPTRSPAGSGQEANTQSRPHDPTEAIAD